MTGKPNLYAIVGMQHRLGGKAAAAAWVAALTPQVPLMLVREPTNKHDPNAVQVWAMDGPGETWRHVAYVSRDQNSVLSRFVDQYGKAWTRPRPVLALDTPMPVGIEVTQAVDARLHVGRNEYPLVEVV